MDSDHTIIKVYPEAQNLSEEIQRAISTGHLWVRATQGDQEGDPVTYLIFSKRLLDAGEAYMVYHQWVEEEIARNGS